MLLLHNSEDVFLDQANETKKQDNAFQPVDRVTFPLGDGRLNIVRMIKIKKMNLKNKYQFLKKNMGKK